MDDARAEEIIQIISEETRIPRSRLGENVPMDTLGMASLDLVQAIFAVECRFKIELPMAVNRAGTEFVTVGDLVKHVLATVDEKDAAAKPAASL